MENNHVDKAAEESWKQKFENWLINNLQITSRSNVQFIIDHVERYIRPSSQSGKERAALEEVVHITSSKVYTPFQKVERCFKIADQALSTDVGEQDEWEYFCDNSYYDMWAVRPKADGNFSSQKLFHVHTSEEAMILCHLLNKI